ncbi:tetratricopeptide repeat protein [Longimicrobium sp.]|uniref:tetratricopeptide repeat protein n=1 Tax=Longimicrobium sp. TaxID=2029185 RepID=UPI002E324FA0|nr:tetratricopeptide repeat protein [Longimicrobium sp.]HEX6038104.1 tetratricopeptide repeat protein [Longimicrobium sp.]
MANAAKLKDQARAAENRGQWTEAVVLYRQLLEENEGEETDIALWNRVGDLHLRLGETERAVEAYERAVAGYADSGLYNNAIALCRKILRLVPGRGAVYLKLGQISAAAGFLADARQNFLEYAQRMKRAGNLDASFDALKEFADLSPEDTDVRKLLADQLLSHDRKEQAVEQMRILQGAYVQRGDADAAGQVREQIRAVAPDADDSPLMRSRSAASDDWDAALTSGEAPRAGGASPAPAGLDLGPTIEPASVQVDVAPLAGLESTALDDGDVAPLAGLESTSLIDDAPPAPPRSAPPALEPGLSLDLEPTAFDDDLPLLDDAEDGEPLPLLLDDEAEDDGGLPLIGFDDEPVPAARPERRAPEPVFEAAPDRLEELRAHVAAVPEDAASRDELVRELRARGLGHEVEEVLENAHRSLAAKGMYFDAVAPITALIGLRPDDGMLLQKRVEYAFRSGRADAQVEAYLGLGRHLARNGQESKAAAVIRRVLELDPHNVEARAAAAQIAPAAVVLPAPQGAPAAPPVAAAPAPAPVPPAAPSPEYVDLGALILDEEGGEPTTRFVVEEKEPSGDEDRDFAEMLAHFRQKVAENIDVEDSASHYDLGVAFMEMGLVDEAIAQFQVALRGGANPLATLELLGQCFVDKGQYAVAGRVLDRAAHLPGVGDGDLVGVLYLLGRIDEATGNAARAREFYERVVSVDIRFRDTSARIERLRGST